MYNMELDDSNFITIASSSYRNFGLFEDSEFQKDVDRIKCIEKLMQKYRKTGEINLRLILNHIIILFNLFEENDCRSMLIFKLYRFLDILFPILLYIGKMPKQSFQLREDLYSSDIPLDETTIIQLRKMRRFQ